MKPSIVLRVLALYGALATTSLFAQPPSKADLISAYEKAVLKPFDDAVVDKLLAKLPNVAGLYVLEGDLLMSREEVVVYLASLNSTDRVALLGPELKVNVVNGRRDFWDTPAQRVIRYKIDRASFANPAQLATLEASLTAAAKDWEAACPGCNVTIREETDAAAVVPSRTPPRFSVKLENAGGAFIAAAFFPSYAESRFVLKIDPSYFTTQFDRVGVLRHELGHVLGYRHEHPGVPGCGHEGGEWLPLTPYDAKSVMHYFCGNGGTFKMALSEKDISGHKALYGPPANPVALAAPGKTDKPTLVVQLRPVERDLSVAIPRVLSALYESGGLPTLYVPVERGDSVCDMFKRTLDAPGGCSTEMISMVQRLNPKISHKGLVPGQLVRMPAIVITPGTYSKDYNEALAADRMAYAAIDASPSGRRASVVYEFVDDKTKFRSVSFAQYEMKIPAASAGQAVSWATLLNQKIDGSLLVDVTGVPHSAPQLHSFERPGDFADACLTNGNAVPLDREGDLADLVGLNSPLCTATCTTHCPEVVVVDTVVHGHPDILSALGEPPPPAASPLLLAGNKQDCHFLSNGTFVKAQHHGTMMAGIIGCQPNGFGLVGLYPKAHLVPLGLDQSPFDLAKAIDQRKAFHAARILLFASEWDSKNSDDKDRWDHSSLSRHVYDKKGNLWIAAAGQDPAGAAGKLLTKASNRAPMNLGDQSHVLVVTGCSPCKGGNAKLIGGANYAPDIVHVAAPASKVASVASASEYAQVDGTSPAAALVAGTAAALYGCHAEAYRTPADVKRWIQATARPFADAAERKKVSAGVLDAQRALLSPTEQWLGLKGFVPDPGTAPPNNNATGLFPRRVQHWCTEVGDDVRLFDPITSKPLTTIPFADVLRIVRVAPDLDQWFVFEEVGSDNGEVRVTGPGTPGPLTGAGAADRLRKPVFKTKDGTVVDWLTLDEVIGDPYVSARLEPCS